MGILHFSFGLGYLAALILELVRQARPNRAARWAGLAFGLSGLLAHTAFLIVQQPNPAAAYGALLLLAWVFAVFYLHGAVPRHPASWAVFVLPVVIALVFLSWLYRSSGESVGSWFSPDHFWGVVHGLLLLAACVGITVGFLASAMYLVQARRLRMKRSPIGNLRLLSLERLETMSRRAINLAFPLLTVGLLLGIVRGFSTSAPPEGWTTAKVLGTAGLWLVALLMLYLRYGVGVPARRLAMLTLVAFALMLLTLVASHPFAAEGVR